MIDVYLLLRRLLQEVACFKHPHVTVEHEMDGSIVEIVQLIIPID